MILRIDHVALAVKDYEKALAFFTKLLGAVPGAYAEDGSMKYLWQICSLGDLSRFELLTPTGDGSFLDGFLENRQGGIHHVTMQTPDINRARQILEENGIPYFGFHDYGPVWKELFIHPRDAFGMLIQIAEFQPDDWLPPQKKMPEGKKWLLRKKGAGADLTFAHPGGGTVTIELSPQEIERLADELKNTIS
ncbi:MAG: VOC family protein [Desulfomonilia bacterium]|jgi:methylmalonyl-CoA/ethylmalonyl-CoA epimerase|uniref:Glyoxalase/Bleomycin resistance protein/Dioxygenase superfamily protein n=1 Tax=anaerobic digester metagenome TaxID=1263854 RepID=A0A485M149_9ZZZZ|nr:VOC family protein [Pseudomonadota bacterium]HON39101.1 VOC family protein [Deltaproteobacteria bacterium]HRS56119.1 VOC family protein [Desulfomonilia bacterium]HPD21204.1 VOC family protein [Deltaproteobacteria bacterium]HPX18171.1 VOC family protein [Deltaproteobacteria bacterium]